jgi:hypothetical protein
MDHIAVLYPDTGTPFVDTFDVVRRLLPYHVFQHPKEDLDMLTKGRKEKNRDNTSGKENDELRTEITGAEHLLQSKMAQQLATETKFALHCFKRRKALQDRFRRAKVKSGKVSGCFCITNSDQRRSSALHLTTWLTPSHKLYLKQIAPKRVRWAARSAPRG